MSKKPTAASGTKSTSGLDVSVVSALANIAAHNDLSEIELEHEGLRIRVARHREPVAVSHVIAAPAAVAPVATAAPIAVIAPAAPAAEPSPGDHPGAVKSPMVGTAYLRASPDSKAFIDIGSVVKAGDKLLLVEAMKTFNEILAPRAGKITRILVEDGSPVEYGQPLVILE